MFKSLLAATLAVSTLAAPAFAGAKGSKVILLTVSDECEYCARHGHAFREEAAKLGFDLDVKINNFDAAEQASQVDQAIAQQPAGIVIFPADSRAVIPSLRKIKQAGIPVVVTNSKPDDQYSEFWDVYVGPDDIGNGNSAAKAMIEGFAEKNLGSSGKIFIVEGVPGTPPQIQRSKGFKDVLAKDAPGIEVAGMQPGNWDQARATDAAAALFTQVGPDVKGVYAQNDTMLAGVIVAAQRAGLDPSKLVLVGSNCTAEGVAAIKAGTQYATVLQSPVDDGAFAAKAMGDLLDGKTPEKTIYLPKEMVTKSNLSICDAANAPTAN
ncbi:sugar ABC transporter substrate-binding protein [Sinorhizobium meliloti]|uniref:sugar ABC transporter substrate-binding protein n=1 Tax=Rhizobium meliloti TaxID=382 RepID=UPI000362DF34|nr:sugar ABC transporter substrate-binding protein [Sinorhizobium meliloti]